MLLRNLLNEEVVMSLVGLKKVLANGKKDIADLKGVVIDTVKGLAKEYPFLDTNDIKIDRFEINRYDFNLGDGMILWIGIRHRGYERHYGNFDKHYTTYYISVNEIVTDRNSDSPSYSYEARISTGSYLDTPRHFNIGIGIKTLNTVIAL